MNITKLATMGLLSLLMIFPASAKASYDRYAGIEELAALAAVGAAAGYGIANAPHSGRFLGTVAGSLVGNLAGGLIQRQFAAPQPYYAQPQPQYIVAPEPQYVPQYYVEVPRRCHHRNPYSNPLIAFLGMADK